MIYGTKERKNKNNMKKRKLLLFLLLISLITVPILNGCDKKESDLEDSEPTPTIAVDNTDPTESQEDLDDEETVEWLVDYPMQMGKLILSMTPYLKKDLKVVKVNLLEGVLPR